MSNAMNRYRQPEESHEMALRSIAGLGVKRPLRRDVWTRAYICAIATLLHMHGDGTEISDLLRTAGKAENILKHADIEDIVALRAAGYLSSPNETTEP